MKGALWGGGGSALFGLLIPPPDCSGGASGANCVEESRAEIAMTMALGGAFIGALVGAIVGSERWDRATLPLRIGVRPMSRGGTLLAFSMGNSKR